MDTTKLQYRVLNVGLTDTCSLASVLYNFKVTVILVYEAPCMVTSKFSMTDFIACVDEKICQIFLRQMKIGAFLFARVDGS